MRVLLPLYSQVVPSVPSGTTILYGDESKADRTLPTLREAGFKQLSINIINSHAGILEIYTRRSPSESFVLWLQIPMAAFSAVNRNMFHLDLEGLTEVQVAWLNGASTQTTWKPSLEVNDGHGGYVDC